MFILMKQRSAIDRQRNRRKGALTPLWLGATDPSNSDNLNGECGGRVCADDPLSYVNSPPHSTTVETRRVPVQRAVERDEIPYPYKVHYTTLRPLLNVTIKSTIVVRSRSRSCGHGDICGTTPA